MILHGDCIEQMKTLSDNSVDAVITDPPYGLSFMGKKWDYDVPSIEVWREVLRVLKPGGHVLSFGGTRTYHRMVVNIEDAGFEIRDQVQWLYGSGFPKSHNISKSIDKMAGVEREVVGQFKYRPNDYEQDSTVTMKAKSGGIGDKQTFDITAPATPDAIKWQGWGSALKPANEPICLARKPLEKNLTLAQNVLKWGTGGLNIDDSRVGTEVRDNPQKDTTAWHGNNWSGKTQESNGEVKTVVGRWPANLILDETAAEMLDEQSGMLHPGGQKSCAKSEAANSTFNIGLKGTPRAAAYKDSGGASRFFYVAKASKSERNAGLEGETNGHPTVKPIKLMEYLCKLITPPGATILDPFSGSGSTGVAATRLGFKFIGCEMDAAYVEIAQKRIDHATAR